MRGGGRQRAGRPVAPAHLSGGVLCLGALVYKGQHSSAGLLHEVARVLRGRERRCSYADAARHPVDDVSSLASPEEAAERRGGSHGGLARAPGPQHLLGGLSALKKLNGRESLELKAIRNLEAHHHANQLTSCHGFPDTQRAFSSDVASIFAIRIPFFS